MINLFQHWKTIQIEDSYCNRDSIYGLLTLMNEKQVFACCYYLNSLKNDLPHFENLYLDEDLLPSDIVFLISKLYENSFVVMRDVVYPKKLKLKFTKTIDLYEVSQRQPPKYMNQELLNKYTRKGAKQAIVERMYDNAFKDDRQKTDDYDLDLKILRQVKEGVYVNKSWNLKNCWGQVYKGKVDPASLDWIAI